MAGGFHNLGKDSLDITELASLNDEISDDMIDQLEQQLTEKLNLEKQKNASVNENDDSTLFEETSKEAATEENAEAKTEDAAAAESAESAEQTEGQGTETSDAEKDAQTAKNEKKEVNQSFDDNFIKKYKAKLKNRAQGGGGDKSQGQSYGGVAPGDDGPLDNDMKDRSSGKGADAEGDIAALSQGKITERSLTGDFKNYNDSLDFLDKNVKYSKYVIYIDPQNVNFIEGLTVKERKNLINGILRQQDDIQITKLRFKVLQTIIRHAIITVLTIAIAIPVVYYVINASLEATINNHRSAQTNWQALYKEHGKITQR